MFLVLEQLGLIYCFPGFGLLWTSPSVQALLYWIGGMVMFGFGGLLAGSRFDFKRPIDQ